jgi:3-deoxy-7-phosphoheptulonate synthase
MFNTTLNLPHIMRNGDQSVTTVKVGDALFGGEKVVLISGPCAVETPEQIELCARLVKEAGGSILRGGIFKPRTSPYSFQGLGLKALKMLRSAADMYDLPIITEVMNAEHVEQLEPVVDMIQIGSRNMQNFDLLKTVGNCSTPVMLKRGMSATLEELLSAAEYIMAGGNENVVICERGIRTFDDFSRNTFDLAIIPMLKNLVRVPVIADPSHATGNRELVIPVSKAAIAAGADGLMVEMHPEPEKALSDGEQSLYPHQLIELTDGIRKIATAVERRF